MPSIIGNLFIKLYNLSRYQQDLYIDGLGEVISARSVWGVKASARIFVDGGKFSVAALAQQLASMGMAAAIIDTTEFFKPFSLPGNECLDVENLAEQIKKIDKEIPVSKDETVFISGIGDGAMIPFINAPASIQYQFNQLTQRFFRRTLRRFTAMSALCNRNKRKQTNSNFRPRHKSLVAFSLE